MNHERLRALFADAVTQDPPSPGLPDDDITRGRARRARHLRRRVAGSGAGAAALVAAALVVPASPLSLIEGERDGSPNSVQPAAATSLDGAPLSPEVADDPLLLEMWEAVSAVLPEDVHFAENPPVGVSQGPYGTPSIVLNLQRGDNGDREFWLNIYLAPARPDLDAFRPCTNPPPTSFTWQEPDECEEGRTNNDHWRIAAEVGTTGVTILENESASVIVQWDVMGADQSAYEILSKEHADTIADAALAVGERHDNDDLFNGIDLVGTLAAWPDVRADVEEALDLGPLTPVEPDDGAREGGVFDPETGALADIDEQWQSGTITARYTTEDGLNVDVLIWQKGRLYDTFCHDRLAGCAVLPGLSEESDETTGYHAASVYTPITGGSGVAVTLETGLSDGLPDSEESEEAPPDTAYLEFENKASYASNAVTEHIPWVGENPYTRADDR
ncbi:hypothetical protein [Phytoactinopolyspora limicola]|uniref:hypothetical protein n=1 Tax=Phytoactinopolyspora limicola TaxID=2715536 RepID=UPI0014080E86|nr:hypothetical protein [Phytoactinopolyspora limicola]